MSQRGLRRQSSQFGKGDLPHGYVFEFVRPTAAIADTISRRIGCKVQVEAFGRHTGRRPADSDLSKLSYPKTSLFHRLPTNGLDRLFAVLHPAGNRFINCSRQPRYMSGTRVGTPRAQAAFQGHKGAHTLKPRDPILRAPLSGHRVAAASPPETWSTPRIALSFRRCAWTCRRPIAAHADASQLLRPRLCRFFSASTAVGPNSAQSPNG